MCALTSKLCAEVWRTGYECSLNPGNENSKLEMETPKFPAKINFNFHQLMDPYRIAPELLTRILEFLDAGKNCSRNRGYQKYV